MTNTIAELEHEAQVIFLIGTNTTENHPVIGYKIKRNVQQNGAKLIVADPRKIEIAESADVFLRFRPGTDTALLNAMIQVILEEGLEDKDFIAQRTEGFEQLAEQIKAYTPEKMESICDVPAEEIRKAARLYASVDKAAICYAMGVTQHTSGTDHVKAISNLAMITGNIGKAGSGVNPLRGQNNVQGACDMAPFPIQKDEYKESAKLYLQLENPKQIGKSYANYPSI